MKVKFMCDECGKLFDTEEKAKLCESTHKADRLSHQFQLWNCDGKPISWGESNYLDEAFYIKVDTVEAARFIKDQCDERDTQSPFDKLPPQPGFYRWMDSWVDWKEEAKQTNRIFGISDNTHELLTNKRTLHSGTIRRVNECGSFTLPKEILRRLSIKADTPLEVWTEGEYVILSKYFPEDQMDET